MHHKCWHGTELGKTSCCPLPSALHCHWVKSWITKVGTGQIRHGVSHWPRGIVGVVIVLCQRYSSLWSSTPPPLNLASSQTWPEYRPSLSSSSSPARLPGQSWHSTLEKISPGSWILRFKISNWLLISTGRCQRNKVTKLALGKRML